jgi:flagella basal body P-ring formation protein FlgA
MHTINRFLSPSLRLSAWALWCAWAFAGLAVLASPGRAQTVAVSAAAQAGAPDMTELTQQWLDNAMADMKGQNPMPLRMQVVVGALDSRLRLAACAKVEPYLPPGTRLWGKTRLGLRCLDGPSRWNVFLPVTVKAFGNAWVIKGGVAPGAPVTENDVTEAEVDWAEEPNAVMADPSQWLGQVATRLLTTGQVLRQGTVRPAQVFQAGSQVKVVAQGAGFQIVSDGQAVSTGVVGQLARVRMDNGRILSGVVLDARTVKMEM